MRVKTLFPWFLAVHKLDYTRRYVPTIHQKEALLQLRETLKRNSAGKGGTQLVNEYAMNYSIQHQTTAVYYVHILAYTKVYFREYALNCEKIRACDSPHYILQSDGKQLDKIEMYLSNHCKVR